MSVRVVGSRSVGRPPSCSSTRCAAFLGLRARSRGECASPAHVRPRARRVACPVTATELASNRGLRPPLPGTTTCGEQTRVEGCRVGGWVGAQGWCARVVLRGTACLQVSAAALGWRHPGLQPLRAAPPSPAHLALGGRLLPCAQRLDGGHALQLGPGVRVGAAGAQERLPHRLGACLQWGLDSCRDGSVMWLAWDGGPAAAVRRRRS